MIRILSTSRDNNLGVMILLPVIVLFTACTAPIDRDITPARLHTGKQGVTFIGYNTGIGNPADDRRSFYKVFIDKAEIGRTTIGLESQKKEFSFDLAPNRHVLEAEKWILDRKSGTYIKLNNVEQPKPNFFYFDYSGDGGITIIMESDTSERTMFTVSGD